MAGHSVLSLFATTLAAGTAAFLTLVPGRLIGRRFFILTSLIALVFLALAIAIRGLEANWFHVAAAALLVAGNVSLPRPSAVELRGGAGDGEVEAAQRSPIPVSLALLVAAAAACAAGLVSDARAIAGSDEVLATGIGPAAPWLVSAAVLSTAAVLGSSLVSMVLGHWYLVVRRLSFGPLRRLTAALAAAIVLRVLIIALCSSTQSAAWLAMWEDSGVSGFLLRDGVFLAARVLFGVVAPLVLVKLVWGCLAVESNQSATGILYVIVAFLLLGEILSLHYLVSAGLLC